MEVSVDGLITGLDTSSIISQLLQIERLPQVRLAERKAEIQKQIDAYQALNTKFGTVRDKADALSSALDWTDKTVRSSDEAVVTATVTGAAASGSLSFSVDALAASHTLIGANAVAGTDVVVASGDFTVNGRTFTAADYGGGTLAEVVDAVNAADIGVAAAAVQVSPGSYKLQLTADASGSDGVFTVATGGLSALGTFGIVSQGANAALTVGSGPAAYQIQSATNTFTDVLPGLTFTANGLGAATLTVDRDAEALADKVGQLVTAYNDATEYIRSRSKYDAETKTAGLFLGSSLPGNLQTSLSTALISPVSGSSLVGKSVGLETDRTGVLSFDRQAFLDAYAADPAAVEAFFSTSDALATGDDGIAERLSLAAEEATRLNTGRIALAIEGRKSEIDNIDDRIDSWDVRLEQREAGLRRQFANLETVLGRLQQQGQWLNGQIASLL